MSRAFQTLVATRSRLYDRGVLPVYRLDSPVISVGNLTTGGTGKTPLVIELARQFLERGHRPVVLSRGYKRESRGVVTVSTGRGPSIDWKQAGDEPYLIARRVPGAAVVVGNDRYRAGREAEQQGLGDLFILDDGFQHRRLHRDVDLLTIDPVEWNRPTKWLPSGRWREPRSAIGRAHAACVQTAADARAPELSIPSFPVETVVDGIGHRDRLSGIDALRGQRVTAFAGIAKPNRFFDLLESLGIELAAKVEFPDHHRYRESDLASLGRGVRITTEKDAVRLGDRDFYFLRISAKIKQFNQLHDLIRHHLDHSR